MGSLLGCGGQCGEEECVAACGRGDHRCCSSGCLATRLHKPVVQTLSAVQDGLDIDLPPPKPERYSLAGADCPAAQAVCGDFGLAAPGGCAHPGRGADDGLFEDAARGLAELSDQVVPFPDCLAARKGTDIPNLGERKDIAALADECRFNAGKLQKVRQLSEAYSCWRSVRGDGNCYYRTVAFGSLEALVACGEWQRLEKAVAVFREVEYERGSEEQRAHDGLLLRLQSRKCLAQIEDWVTQDAELDQALIRACRRIVRLFLVRNADQRSKNDMTYAELVHALDSTYLGVEDFCARVVDPMGRDAETLALDALPLQLGVGVRTWILDRRDDVELVSMDAPGPEGEVDVHVLFKPGHYDLLYPRRDSDPRRCACAASGQHDGREFEAVEDAVPACYLPAAAAPAEPTENGPGQQRACFQRGPFPL